VEAPYTFYIPNCFTPNGDGNNEMFFGEGTYIKTFHILIFDRWGNKIYESNDVTKGWDGKVQGGSSGKLVEEDVYVWKIEIEDTNSKIHKYMGRVTLVR
jgi:gliding motility-associated-like protein